MRKVSVIVLIVFTLVAQAKTIRVGEGRDFIKIRPAIVFAASGDTVIVEKGIYKEGNLIIDKSIFFLGEGFAIIDGEKKY